MLPVLSALTDLLYPPSCWACGSSLERQAQALCGACALVPLGEACRRCGEPQGPGASTMEDCDTCRGRPLAFSRVAALGRYEGGLRRAVQRAKFEGELGAWAWMGKALADHVAALPWAGEVDAVVPVPSTWRARLARGANPAALLAGAVSRRLERPRRPWLLRRPTPPQVGLGRRERLANVEGAFRISPEATPSGLRLLLVDDVMTTGATVDVCARALKAAGALRVDVAVAAR